jgi:hypothetical protein
VGANRSVVCWFLLQQMKNAQLHLSKRFKTPNWAFCVDAGGDLKSNSLKCFKKKNKDKSWVSQNE